MADVARIIRRGRGLELIARRVYVIAGWTTREAGAALCLSWSAAALFSQIRGFVAGCHLQVEIFLWSMSDHSDEHGNSSTFFPFMVFVPELRTEETSNNGQVLTVRKYGNKRS